MNLDKVPRFENGKSIHDYAYSGRNDVGDNLSSTHSDLNILSHVTNVGEGINLKPLKYRTATF